MIDHIDWLDPEMRGIIPVENFKLRDDLLRVLKKEKNQTPDKKFEIKVNADFLGTITACSKPRGTKTYTWLTPDYIKAAMELHKIDVAHSVETYQNGVLGRRGHWTGHKRTIYNVKFISIPLTMQERWRFIIYLLKLKEDGFKLHFTGAADSWFTQFG